MTPLRLMERCLQLCDKTIPAIFGIRVGALVLHNGRIVGQGCREFLHNTPYVSGFPDYNQQKRPVILHAERVAIWNADEKARGGILYTTVEPCFEDDLESGLSSCCNLIIESGIIHVVIGCFDTNPDIRGRSREYLLKNDISVAYYPVFEKEIKRYLSPKNRYRYNKPYREMRQARERHKERVMR